MLTVLGIGACSLGFALIGLLIGAEIGDRRGGHYMDFGIPALFAALVGAIIGGIVGSVVGGIVFT